MNEEDDDFEERPRRERLHREDLRAIANYQRGIIVCILINLALYASQFAVPEDKRLILLIGIVPAAIASTVFVFLLSTKVYSTGTGVILGILTLIPCIGLIVLLIINGKATATLKQHRIRVGFFGANTADI